MGRTRSTERLACIATRAHSLTAAAVRWFWRSARVETLCPPRNGQRIGTLLDRVPSAAGMAAAESAIRPISRRQAAWTFPHGSAFLRTAAAAPEHRPPGNHCVAQVCIQRLFQVYSGEISGRSRTSADHLAESHHAWAASCSPKGLTMSSTFRCTSYPERVFAATLAVGVTISLFEAVVSASEPRRSQLAAMSRVARPGALASLSQQFQTQPPDGADSLSVDR